MHQRWCIVDIAPPVGYTELDPVTHNEIRRNYAAMSENIDPQVDRFLALLEACGQLENTVVVYASDHGEMLGDHIRARISVTLSEQYERLNLLANGVVDPQFTPCLTA